MFILDLLYNGLPTNCMNGPPKILFLGLDNSGKTTLLSALRYKDLSRIVPTITPPAPEKFSIGKTICNGYDLGGHLPLKGLWKQYTYEVSGIIFCVDAADPDRFDEAKFELDKLLVDKNLNGVPILVFGNKINAPRAVDEETLTQALGIAYNKEEGKSASVTNPNRSIETFMCSFFTREGIESGLRWLSEFMVR